MEACSLLVPIIIVIIDTSVFSPTLPSPRSLLLDLAGFALVDEVLFYTAHRAAHHRAVYKYVHKV